MHGAEQNSVKNTTLACPNCGSADQVQKVTAVVSAGQSESKTSNFGTTYSLLNNANGLAFTTTTGVQHSATELAQRLSPPPRPTELPLLTSSARKRERFGFWCVQVVLWATIVGIPISIIWLVSEMRKANAAKAQLPQWEQAMQQYNRLFYCFRCDGVFKPNENFVPADQIQHFLVSAR